MNDIAGGGEAELGQEVLHGLRPDLGNGQLFPKVLHPNVSSQLEKSTNCVLRPLLSCVVQGSVVTIITSVSKEGLVSDHFISESLTC